MGSSLTTGHGRIDSVRILLTGAFGYLGGRIADHLRAGGAHVVLAGRHLPLGARRWAERYEARYFDVLDKTAVLGACVDIDVIAHLAALDEREATAHPDLARRVSEEGTENLLQGAIRCGARGVAFFSTFHVYGPTGDAAIDEMTPTAPRHPYAVAHLAGEEACRRHSDACSTAILRISNGYGAPVWKDVDRWTLAHNDFCRQALETGVIRLATTGHQHRDFVWVEDVAAALRIACEAIHHGRGSTIYNVGGACSLSIFDLAQRVQLVAARVLMRPILIERPESGVASVEPPVRFATHRLNALGYAPTDAIDRETERVLALLAINE